MSTANPGIIDPTATATQVKPKPTFWSGRNIASYLTVLGFAIMGTAKLEVTQITVHAFDYPLIIRYLCCIQRQIFVSVLVVWKCYRRGHKLPSNILRERGHTSELAQPMHTQQAPRSSLSPLQWFVAIAAVANILQFGSGTIQNVSSQRISVPTMNAISGIRPVFVLLLSVALLRQRLTLWMVAAMLLALGGLACFVVEVDMFRSSGSRDTLDGVLLTVAWNLGFAMHDIMSKKVYQLCYHPQQIILGSISYVVLEAAFSLVLFSWTLFFPNNLFEVGLAWHQLFWILLMSCCIFIFQSLLCVGIALKSPFYVNMGSLLSIPLSFVVDVFVHHYKPNVFAIAGAVCLVFAFLMLEILKPNAETGTCRWLLCCDKVLIDRVDKEKKLQRMGYSVSIKQIIK